MSQVMNTYSTNEVVSKRFFITTAHGTVIGNPVSVTAATIAEKTSFKLHIQINR